MKSNEMEIINNLDKENDDLMSHLGILQQFSLDQETNVLKEIKNYNDDTNYNEYEKKENLKEEPNNNMQNKFNQKKKLNKKIMDMIRKKEESDKVKQKNNNINNINNNNYLYNNNLKNQEENEPKEIKLSNKNLEILEDSEKCIININNYNKNKKGINIINNNDNNDINSSSDDEININNKLIEEALNVEKKLKENLYNYNQMKKQNGSNDNIYSEKDKNINKKIENKDLKINNIIDENDQLDGKINLNKDIIGKYNLDDNEEEIDVPKNPDFTENYLKNEDINIKENNEKYNYNNKFNYSNSKEHENNINEIKELNKELDEDFNIIKSNKNKINIHNDINNNEMNIIKSNNNLSNNNNDSNFVCDLDIFKKLQQQMNKKSEVLQKTIEKYNHIPKKLEIINDSNKIQNKLNTPYNEKVNITNTNKYNFDLEDNNKIDKINISQINKKGIEDLSREKINLNNKNLIEKINNIKNRVGNNDKINIDSINDKDSYIKKEIGSTKSLYDPLIFKIPSLLLDDKIEEIEIYIKLEMIYSQLKTITSKLDFISLLRQVLNNILMLKNSSFNAFMNLFNFILNLQIYELNLSDCNPSLPCEYLKSLLDLLINNKDLTDMIRIIIVLIKKYFPINMSIILEQKIIVILKVLISCLKQLNKAILSAYINIKSIFIEINDFLFFSPPSLLSDEFPLGELFMEIYEEIRNTTDSIIKSCKSKIMKNELMEAIIFIKSKIKNKSLDYIKYLDYAIYKMN